MESIQNKKIFDNIDSDELAAIYEMFLEMSASAIADEYIDNQGSKYYTSLNDLTRKPSKSWYKKLNDLINAYGHENYRNHVKAELEHLIQLQKYNNKYDHHRQTLAEYYFFCSDSARYLRGVILSITCLPDPYLLELLKEFAIIYPFQSAPNSQAPTGLFTYDVMDVFSELPTDIALSYLFTIKNRIKSKYFQKKIDGVINKMAKKLSMSTHELTEMGVSDFGLDDLGVLEMTIGDYLLRLEFTDFKEDRLVWKHVPTQKVQIGVPKEIKENHSEKHKYLKKHIQDIKSQVINHAKRIEGYLYEERVWSYASWKKHYQNHHLIRVLAKSLVWMFEVQGVFREGVIVGDAIQLSNGTNLIEAECTGVKLWHPVYGALSPDLAALSQFKNQCFSQIDRPFYGCSFIQNQVGKKMKKDVLAQLYKAREWSNSFPDLKRKIPPLGIEVLVEIEDVNDGTYGKIYGSNTCVLKGVTYKVNGAVVNCEEINKVAFSELSRDVDLFVQKAALA